MYYLYQLLVILNVPYLMNEKDSINVDNESDFILAEYFLKERNS